MSSSTAGMPQLAAAGCWGMLWGPAGCSSCLPAQARAKMAAAAAWEELSWSMGPRFPPFSLLLQTAARASSSSSQSSGEQAQQAAQLAAQQQGPAQPAMPDPAQQLNNVPEQQPAAQAWYEQEPVAQPGLLPLPPHLSSQPQLWEQQAAVQPAYGWQQQEPSSLWQHSEQPAGYDDGYAAGLAAAAAMMQQQGMGMSSQAQAFQQAAPPAQAYVPPQARPEGDEAEVDALLSLLGIG